MGKRETERIQTSRDRAARGKTPGQPAPARKRARWAAPVALAFLVIGLISGAGHAAASSQPGDVFYRLKFPGGDVLIPQGPGEPVQMETQTRAMEQVRRALGAASQAGLLTRTRLMQRLEVMLQERVQKMAAVVEGLPEPLQQQVRLLLREMERVRQEAHAGQGDPEGEQSRQRLGTPKETPPGEPQGPMGPGQPAHAPGPQPPDRPAGPQPAEPPGQGSVPPPAGEPKPEPAGEPAQEAGPAPDAGPSAPLAPQPADAGPGAGPGSDPGQGTGPGESPAQGGGK